VNILIVTPFPFLPPKGGIEFQVLGLSKHLVKRGHNILIVSSSDVNRHVNGVEVFGVKSFHLLGWPYHPLKNFSIPYRPWSLVSLMKKIIHEYKVDLLHAHGQLYLCTWVAMKVASGEKIPAVLTIHGTSGLRYYDPIANSIEEIFSRTVLKQTIRRASAVICATQLEEEHVRQYCKNANFFKIPNGVYVETFREALGFRQKFRKEYQIPLDRKVVLFVGRFTPVKGILELMETIRNITKVFPEALFLIVGDGPLRGKVERVAELQGNMVRMFKWIPGSEMHKLYALSDIFVLPSRSEGQPLTLLEAMASQLYIVSTPVGGIPETLRGYGYKTYISHCSTAEISAGILEALEAISKGKSIDSKSVSYAERFDWSHVTTEIEGVYSHLLKGRSSRSLLTC